MAKDSLLKRWRAGNIEILDKHLVENHNALRLCSDQIKAYPVAEAGWQIRQIIENIVINIYLTVDRQYPFSSPSIFLPKNSNLIKLPHVEACGRSCLNPNHSSFTQDNFLGLADYTIQQASALISDGIKGLNQGDFIDEFESYWERQEGLSPRPIYSLIEPSGPSRIVHYFDGKNYILVGESKLQCQQWLTNRSKDLQDPQQTYFKTLFVWLNKPLLPNEYPKSNLDFSRLLSESSTTDKEMLESILPQDKRSLPVMFGFETVAGAALGGLILANPKNKYNGFRPGNIPTTILARRFYSTDPIIPISVQKVNASWIHSRGGEDRSLKLNSKRVMLIGCGSLGSAVAFQLAKAGVGFLHLIDGDSMAWDNIGRHALGGDSVGMRKDKAIQQQLLHQLPHLSVETYSEKSWQDLYERRAQTFHNCDLIISTTGSWTAEGSLNLIGRQDINFAPILFGWAEANAAAGHSLLVHNNGGCLACGMDAVGHFSLKATEWPKEMEFRRVPACGGWYQPYGYIPLSFISTHVSQMAVDYLLQRISKSEIRTWIGTDSEINELSGKISPSLKIFYKKDIVGDQVLRQIWEKNPQCSLCR